MTLRDKPGKNNQNVNWNIDEIAVGRRPAPKYPQELKIHSNNKQKYHFLEIVSRLTDETQKKLKAENLIDERVFARLTIQQINQMSFRGKDLKILTTLISQCRTHEFLQTKKIKLHNFSENPITQRFPIGAKITIKLLKRYNKHNPIQLYLLTDITEMKKIFDKYPSIPKKDKLNIFFGMALARYANTSAGF